MQWRLRSQVPSTKANRTLAPGDGEEPVREPEQSRFRGERLPSFAAWLLRNVKLYRCSTAFSKLKLS